MKVVSKSVFVGILTSVMIFSFVFASAEELFESQTIGQYEEVLLNDLHIDISEVEVNNNSYTISYGESVETLEFDSSLNQIIVSDGNISNAIYKGTDGELYIDGNEIEVVYDDPIVQLQGTVYKGTKSLQPYGSLKDSDYTKFGGTKTANLQLGKAIDELTATALATIISYCYGYAGIAVSLGTIAKGIKDVVVAQNPKTDYLGYKCQTYIHSYTDYKYKNLFYAEAACKTLCKTTISYEHFLVS